MAEPVNDLLLDLFARAEEHVHTAVEGLDAALVDVAPEPGANPIGWLVWHLTRQQDAQIAELAGEPQVWVGDGWAARFGLQPDPDNHGYGHSPAEVAAVRAENPQALLDYHAAVAARTRSYVQGLKEADLTTIVDEHWDPPVTLAVRVISIADDAIQHGGQAAYARGILERR